MGLAVTPIRLTLKNAREAKGLTQAQLAKRIGIRQATISDLETGKSGRIDLQVLDSICRALDVAPGDLLVLEPRKRK